MFSRGASVARETYLEVLEKRFKLKVTTLADCLLVTEGGATVRDGNVLDLVLTCAYEDGGDFPQRIVLLRSSTHLASLSYVATLLTPADAAPLGAAFYSAPAMLANEDGAPLLIVTPVVGGTLWVQLPSIDGSYELQARTSPWRDEPRELAVSIA